MLVVLEGCDGSGKSTLARFLSKIMNAEIVHCTDYEQTLDQLRKYVKGFENIFKQSSLNIYRYNTLTGGIELWVTTLLQKI